MSGRSPGHRRSQRYARDESHSRKTIPKPNVGMVSLWALAQRFQRYWLDLVGWPLLALAAVSLFALFDRLSAGSMVNAWGRTLASWLGWGKFIVPAFLAWLGIVLLRRNFGRPLRLRWGRIIAAELAGLAGLGLLHQFDGGNLSHVVTGRGGGIIGWSVGQAFAFFSMAPPLEILILSLVFAIAWLIPQVGAGSVMITLLAGQVIGGLVMSHFGWLGSPVEPITWVKVAGVLVMVAGAAMATLVR